MQSTNIVQFSHLETTNQSSLTQDSRVQNSMTPEGPLGELIKQTSQWTNDAISILFDNVDTQLFERAERADNSTDQNTYFDAMRIIRLRRSIAQEHFTICIEQTFNIDCITNDQRNENLIVATDLENLSLVEDDNLEEDLATNSMVVKAVRDNRDNLSQLNQRLSYLYNGLTITTLNNPMGPTALCNSFASAVNSLEAEIKVKLLIFKLFDIHVINQLSEFYEKSNHQLVELGILPNLKVNYKNIVKQPPARPMTGLGGLINTPVQTNEVAEESSGGGLSQFLQQPQHTANNDNESQVFTLIQQLINQNQSSQQALTAAEYASTEDVMSSLTQIQPPSHLNSETLLDGSTTSQLLKEALKQSLQTHQQKQAINQSDDSIIDVIGMLFDFILNDHNLVDSVKSLLSRLQIPIIKIALQDPNFFKTKNHSARKLLNELANAGLGVTDNINAQNNPLFLKLENLVNRMSSDQANDSAFFEELLEDLHRFLIQFNQGRGISKGPSKEAALNLVKTELESRTHNKSLPDNIVLLLGKVWQDVMIDIFFSDGMESDEWDMAMTFVDTLIWSIVPKQNIQSQKQLVRVIPGILNALNAGLDRIRYPKQAREQLLQDLQNCHLACMKGKIISDNELSQNGSAYVSSQQIQQQRQEITKKALNNEPLTAEELEHIDAGVDIMLDGDLSNLDALEEEALLASLEDGSEQAIADDGQSELIEDNFTQQARELTAGAWVEFYGNNDTSYRAKISWMSEDASAYIFVTQTGQIAEKTLQGLSDALRKEQAIILDESPVFERAMDAVLEDLQDNT
jgi:hypothetical protein